MKIETPYYLIDERKLLVNLKKIQYLRNHGIKVVLALKCFSTWGVFPLLRKYLDGTTSSSLYEARLGFEKFGKETHAYCVGYTASDVKAVKKYCDKIIFNSVSQLKRFAQETKSLERGLRLNPGVSYSHFDLADPARPCSRLGVMDKYDLNTVLPKINGVMFHFNCENADFANFALNLDFIAEKYADILPRLKWISLGGGIYFTQKDYPMERFAAKLKEFSDKFKLQVYLEPGEAVITGSTELVTQVVDIVRNEVDIAVVDASTEAHMLDLLIYRLPAKLSHTPQGKFKYMVAGRSCLAGDIFGTFGFNAPLKVGATLRFLDAAGYTMVKKNWFNGLAMPAIVIKKLNGALHVARRFTYNDFKSALS